MNFFYGRYGVDILSLFLILISNFFSFSHYTSFIALIILFIVVFRTFSKNISKRQSECFKFIGIINKVLAKFNKTLPYNFPVLKLDSIPLLFQNLNKKFANWRQFKIVKCPNCGQKLRLPRGKKHIVVTCKKCSHEFKMRT